MQRQNEEVHVSKDEARGGSSNHIVRYVLAISLVLAIVAMGIIWMRGAATASQGSHTGDVTNQAVPSQPATVTQ